MSEAVMPNDEEPQIFQGVGETIDKALEDAATKALDRDRVRNLGREFQIVRHLVTVENPRISEHRIDIGG